MSERTVYISPFQFGALRILGAVVNSSEFLKHRDPINVNAIVYGSMIQCGVEIFEMPKGFPYSGEKDIFPHPEFLKSRIRNFSDNKGTKAQKSVKDAFSKFLPENYKKSYQLIELEQFITDLVFSAERRTSCMTLFPIPEIDQLENQLPPEVFFPIKNLLSSFELLQPNLPYPKLSIQASDIKKFEQLLSSDLFSHYAIQHEKLQQTSIPIKNALANVVKGGKGIVQKNIDFLHLKEVTISVLPLTAKLIDGVFGKLPGTLADYSANLLTGLLEDKKRIVVYQLGSLSDDLLRKYAAPYRFL